MLYPRSGAVTVHRSDRDPGGLRRAVATKSTYDDDRDDHQQTAGKRAGAALALALCALAVSASVAQAAATFSWSAPAVADSSSTHTTAISCPSTGLCVAVDAGGNVVYTTTPASGGWSAPLGIVGTSGHQLTAISCPTTSLCFAADNHGDVYSSTAPTSVDGLDDLR